MPIPSFLNTFIQYYTTAYAYRQRSIQIQAVAELSAYVRVHGIKETRMQIRSIAGKAPFLTKLLEQNEEGEDLYWIRSLCREYLLNGERTFSLSTFSSIPNRAGHLYHWTGLDPDTGLYVLVPNNTHNPVYQGHPLSNWIEFGGICEDCGTPFLATTSSQTCCDSCSIQYNPKQYSHRVEEDLGFEETEEIRFGIELEYENVTGKQVYKTLRGHAQAKRDGSIRSGVEIVTRPACISTHKEKLADFYSQVAVKAESNTGMHVHIEKARLSQYQIGFIMQFLNNRTLAENIKTIAGRDYVTNYYTSLKDEHTMTYGLYYDDHDKKVIRNNTDKYSALNTAKQHTVEVRIFASPNNAEECFARLDFVNALVQYSSPYTVSVKALKDKFTWATFTSYVKSHKKDFPHLYTNYMKEAS